MAKSKNHKILGYKDLEGITVVILAYSKNNLIKCRYLRKVKYFTTVHLCT